MHGFGFVNLLVFSDVFYLHLPTEIRTKSGKTASTVL